MRIKEIKRNFRVEINGETEHVYAGTPVKAIDKAIKKLQSVPFGEIKVWDESGTEPERLL